MPQGKQIDRAYVELGVEGFEDLKAKLMQAKTLGAKLRNDWHAQAKEAASQASPQPVTGTGFSGGWARPGQTSSARPASSRTGFGANPSQGMGEKLLQLQSKEMYARGKMIDTQIRAKYSLEGLSRSFSEARMQAMPALGVAAAASAAGVAVGQKLFELGQAGSPVVKDTYDTHLEILKAKAGNALGVPSALMEGARNLHMLGQVISQSGTGLSGGGIGRMQGEFLQGVLRRVGFNVDRNAALDQSQLPPSQAMSADQYSQQLQAAAFDMDARTELRQEQQRGLEEAQRQRNTQIELAQQVVTVLNTLVAVRAWLP